MQHPEGNRRDSDPKNYATATVMPKFQFPVKVTMGSETVVNGVGRSTKKAATTDREHQSFKL